MSTNTKLIGGVVLAVLIAVFALVRSGPGPQGPQGPGGSNGGDGLGAISSPDIPSPYLSFGNVRRFAAHKAYATTATSTPCALQSPAATSTLVMATGSIKNASTTTMVLQFFKGTNYNATTSQLATDLSVTGGAQADWFVVAATSSLTQNTFAPNQWFVVGAKGGGGGFTPTGQCSATWEAHTFE